MIGIGERVTLPLSNLTSVLQLALTKLLLRFGLTLALFQFCHLELTLTLKLCCFKETIPKWGQTGRLLK